MIRRLRTKEHRVYDTLGKLEMTYYTVEVLKRTIFGWRWKEIREWVSGYDGGHWRRWTTQNSNDLTRMIDVIANEEPRDDVVTRVLEEIVL